MADFKMADQFKGLPMGELIGGPLMAACDAQVRLANATSDFIKVVGFMPPTDPQNKDALGPVRTATFKFTRPTTLAGKEAPKPGEPLPTEDVTLEVPLLAIVKVPSLAIKTVDVTFDMEVKNSETSKESTDASATLSADVSVGWGPFSAKVHISGSVSSHKENTRATDQSAKYHVSVRAADEGMPEGLARVLDMMNSSIAPKTITAN
ncbi:MAG TPA: DUF2589 domain-containing protein [Myxococcaceae bacterium]|nr:DUF2589 domain-containing protein [Myxococcaceae bacterium]